LPLLLPLRTPTATANASSVCLTCTSDP
jgi:hypothetical protein